MCGPAVPGELRGTAIRAQKLCDESVVGMDNVQLYRALDRPRRLRVQRYGADAPVPGGEIPASPGPLPGPDRPEEQEGVDVEEIED